MLHRALRWPNSCDYRAAWWGVRGNVQWTPMPRRIAARLQYRLGIGSPDFYRPSWFGPLDRVWGFEVDEMMMAQDVWGFLPLESDCPLRWMRGEDRWDEWPTGGRFVRRGVSYRFESPTGTEFIEGAVRLFPDTTYFFNGPSDWWGVSALPDSVELVSMPTDWNVAGWPAPQPLPNPRPLLGLYFAGARPPDWIPD